LEVVFADDVGFVVVLLVALAEAFTVGVGVAFFVAATAELPDTAIASTRKRVNFFNRAPT